jgi:hypothetical protein
MNRLSTEFNAGHICSENITVQYFRYQMNLYIRLVQSWVVVYWSNSTGFGDLLIIDPPVRYPDI